MTSEAPPKLTRETFAMRDDCLKVVDAVEVAAYRYEQMPPARRKELNDKGVGISEMLLLLTLEAMSQSTLELKREEVDAIFEARERIGD